MWNENITFIGVGRIRDQTILASAADKLSNNEKNMIEMTFHSYLLDAVSRFAPGSRERRLLGEGCMYLLADNDLCCIYAVAMRLNNYPERHAFALLSEVARSVELCVSDRRRLNSLESNSLTKNLKKHFKELMEKYDKPQNFDKIIGVRQKVDDVKEVMHENVKKILETHANIESLQDKTENLASSASQFQRNAGDLRRAMWWRKAKVSVILGLVVIALIAYIILIIVHLAS